MFCPRCATPNADDTKFCRACGTNLQVVSLALSHPDKLTKVQITANDWLAKRREGISTLVKGTGLIGASGLVGTALAIFSNTNDWIFVWLGLASWMACWGIILWSQGISALIESRSLRLEWSQTSPELSSRSTKELLPNDPPPLITAPEAPATTRLAGESVTEHTTELLNK